MVRKVQLQDSSSLENILSDIQKSNLFYQHLVEVTPDAIVVHSEGKIVYANPKAVQLIGARTTTDVIGKSVMKFIHPDSLPLINARIQKLLSKIRQRLLLKKNLSHLQEILSLRRQRLYLLPFKISLQFWQSYMMLH